MLLSKLLVGLLFSLSLVSLTHGQAYNTACSSAPAGTKCSCFRDSTGNFPATSCTQPGKRDYFDFFSSNPSVIDCFTAIDVPGTGSAGPCTISNGNCDFTIYTGNPVQPQPTTCVDAICCYQGPASTCGNGVVEPGEQCDVVNPCCVSCQFASTSTICRAAVDDCDVAELCTGNSVVCPNDLLKASTEECRPVADVCDVAEMCTGDSATCPTDAFLPSSVECRPVADVCDVAEMCTGDSAPCPTDAFLPSSVECRPVADVCDVAEMCTGDSAPCPTDAFLPSSVECRGVQGDCDVADFCSGNSSPCVNNFLIGTLCRAANGVCDVADFCPGDKPQCPFDRVAMATVECRASIGICDVAENCTGVLKTCPIDEYRPDGSRCDDGRATTHSDMCVDNTCTSCTDRKYCADVKDISLTLPDGQLICGDVVNPDSGCPAPKLKITGWDATTLANNNYQSVTLLDFTGCFAPTFANNTLVGFSNAANGHSIVFSRNGQCWLKFIKPDVVFKRNALQATTITVTIAAAHLLPAVGGATGDPHITGPRGEHFEFQGQPGARYVMIASPKVVVSVQMSLERGTSVHFMTQVHFRVGDVEFTAAQISLFDASQNDLAPYNAKLAVHNSNVTIFNRRHNGIVPLPPQLVLSLCGGQERVIITAIKPSQRQVAAFHLFETTHYYNIEFEVAGCHDELDGVIGQLYQCKYNAQPFVYDAAAVEQRFVVKHFDDVPASFKPRASCLQLQAHEDIVGGAAAFK